MKYLFNKLFDIFLAIVVLFVCFVVGYFVIGITMLALTIWFTQNSIASVYRAFIKEK